MANYSLIIPIFEDGNLLQVRIAGLTLLKRIAKTARRAGIQTVIVLSTQIGLPPKEMESIEFVSGFQEVKKKYPGPCIILKCGYLPDTVFFKSLVRSFPARLTFFTLDSLPPLVVAASSPPWENLGEIHDWDHFIKELKQASPPEFSPLSAGNIYDVTDGKKGARVEDQLFKGLIKKTEGFMSRHFERKISIALTKRLVKTAITPNEMTLVSVLVGLLGAFFMAIDRGFWQIAGSGLFLLQSILDGCDGEIARIRFEESRWGGLFDFWGDNVVRSAVMMAIAWEWGARTQNFFPFMLAMVAVLTAWGSAGLVYWTTMRSKSGEGPLYTSVSSSSGKNRVSRIADFLSRRDFIYLIVILAVFGHLDWFLYASAVGTPVFTAVLLGLMVREKIRIGWGMKAEEERGGRGR